MIRAPEKYRSALGAGLAALVLAGAGCYALSWWAAPKDYADPADPVQVALGRRLYAAHCASCHGAGLQGQPNWRQRRPDGSLPAPPHDAGGHTWHHPDALLFRITKEGTAAIVKSAPPGAMPGFGEILSDAEIWAILAYIKSTWPAEIRQRQQGAARN